MESIPMSMELPNDIITNKKRIKKMLFITNALNNGWTVKKVNESYVFTKKHENLREVFKENYLENFVIQSISSTDSSL